MGLYAIGDLHLSLSVNKPMDIFGEVWKDHTEKLRASFSQLRDDDTALCCAGTRPGEFRWRRRWRIFAFGPIARPEDPAQRKSRLLVGDSGKMNAFCRA